MKNIICDIDGVLLHDNKLIPGSDKFIQRILAQGNPLVVLTNYPVQTGKDLQNRLSAAGMDIPEECFYTSAMATADFLKHQEGSKAFVIGEGALTHELYKAGFTITDINPDFVIIGETRSYNWEMIHKAAGFVPAVRALLPPIQIPTVQHLVLHVAHYALPSNVLPVKNLSTWANRAPGLFALRLIILMATRKIL